MNRLYGQHSLQPSRKRSVSQERICRQGKAHYNAAIGTTNRDHLQHHSRR